MEKAELKELRTALPRGTRYKKINEVLKGKGVKEYSRGYIKAVLLGKEQNSEIIIAAIEVLQMEKESLKEATEAFKAL